MVLTETQVVVVVTEWQGRELLERLKLRGRAILPAFTFLYELDCNVHLLQNFTFTSACLGFRIFHKTFIDGKYKRIIWCVFNA